MREKLEQVSPCCQVGRRLDTAWTPSVTVTADIEYPDSTSVPSVCSSPPDRPDSPLPLLCAGCLLPFLATVTPCHTIIASIPML
jgi:hypothetical protein